MILDIGNYRNVEESCQMPSSIPQGTPASRGAVYVVEEAQSEKLRFQTSRLKATSGLSLPLRGPPPKANSCISMDASLEVLAMRPLEGDHWTENDSLHVQSLRGKVPPTGGNPCTHIPGRGSGRFTFEMDVAGGGHATQAAFPGHVISFAAATASVTPMTLKSKDQFSS
ncbi:hypothetical protein ACFX11_010635 [Malus domestica]